MDEEFPPAADAYLTWLLNPKRSGTKRAFAKSQGVSYEQLLRWDRTEWFKRAKNERLGDMSMGAEHIQKLAAKMLEVGLAGDVQATKQYVALVAMVNPSALQVTDRGLPDLSDEELEELWAEGRVP